MREYFRKHPVVAILYVSRINFSVPSFLTISDEFLPSLLTDLMM